MSDQPKTEKSPTQSERDSVVAKGATQNTGGARLRVRKIRHSPAADPKLVKAFYAVAVDLRKKRLQKDNAPKEDERTKVPVAKR